MVNTQPPPIKEAGYPMNLGHDNVGWVAAGGNIFRLVFEADSRETVVGSPAIGSNRCSRAHSRLDERNEALGGCVLDTRHADTTGAPTPDFGGNRDNRFLVCFPPRNANLPAAHIGFVDLDLAIQKLSARSNHGPAQLMEPCPSRLITAQAEYSLNPKRTDAVLLIRHIPHRLEPKPQRFPRTLEDRPRGRRRLTLASRTSLLAPGRHPRLGSPAGRTPKPGRPTDTPKKIRTGGLRSEPVVKFHKRARVIDPANGMGSILGHHNILPLRERIGYPISAIDVTFKGEDEEQKAAQEFLSKAFAVALFIMALILVTQFNSFYSGFLILSAVIMSTVGVMLGLLIIQQPFGIIMSGVGVIALAGIVVNNNIVLIDTYDRIRKTVHNPASAILITGAQRLRPVLLTSVTTILGLMPMVLGINIDFITRKIAIGGPSTQWWTQLSTAIAFGLAFATILTLLVTPSALMLKANVATWRARRRGPAGAATISSPAE